ncbi:MAG: alcohol dehydrogenase [Conexibacter sp.]|nr:alcohol dehydrogenase [Conexibacter sp.]
MRHGEVSLLPTRTVAWGAGSHRRLPELIEQAGARRVLLLTLPALVEQGELLASVEDAIGPLLVGRFAELDAHVPAAGVRAGAQRVRDLGADAVISLGGGSVIDAAKAIVGAHVDAGQPLPLHVSLPTTLSGAEFAHYYGVTEETRGERFKRSYARAELTPSIAVLDPELTAATPPQLWSSSAIKAIDHAAEGLLGGAPGILVAPQALLGIRHMSETIGDALAADALAARLTCQLAAWECYVAPASITLGLSHRIGHVLGGTFGVPHGLTSGITLAPVMRAMAPVASATLSSIATALDPNQPLDLASTSSGDPARAGDLLEALVRSLQLPTRLRDVGIARETVAAIAASVQDVYPASVAQLGSDAETRLRTLLEEMW